MEHKHKGVERSNGTLRSHPIQRQHKDEKIKRFHNDNLTPAQKKYFQPTKNKPLLKKLMKKSVEVTTPKQPKNSVNIPIDDDGYISMDLGKTNVKGVRISFVRVEGRKRRTIGLQIENER